MPESVGIGFDLDAGPAVATVQKLGAASESAAVSADKLDASTRRIGASSDGLSAAQRELQRRMQEVLAAGKLLDQHNETAVTAYQRQVGAVRDLAVQMKDLALVQDQLASASALAGSATDKVSEAIQHGSAHHETHIHGLSRIGNALSSMVAEATGVPSVFERIGDSIGVMSIGHLATVGVVAGFAVLAVAWEKLTEKAREAKKEAEDAFKVLEQVAKRREQGAAGEVGAALPVQRAEMDKQLRLAQDYQRQLDALNAGADRGETTEARRRDLERRLDDARQSYRHIADVVQAGEEEAQRLTTQAAERERSQNVSNLAERLRFNQRDAEARREALALLKKDREEYAKLLTLPASADTSAKLAQSAGEIKTLNDALNPKPKTDRDANKQAGEARQLEQIAAAEERRVVAARALDEAVTHGQAAFERERHSQELQNQLLETENRIRAAHLDITGKVRVGEEAAMDAEIARARTAIQTRDMLDQHAKTTLDIGKEEQQNAALKAQIDAYNGVGTAVKDATVEEEYRAKIIAASAVTDDAQRERLFALADQWRDYTLALHGAEAAHKANDEAAKKSAEEQRRQVEELDRLLKSTFSSFFTDLFTKGKNAFQSLWDAIKAGFIKLLADLAAARLTEKLAGVVGGSLLGMLSPNVAGAQNMGNGAGQGGIADASVSIPGMGGMSTGMGYGAIGLGALTTGYGVGSSLYSSSHGDAGNYARGALGGAASGAAMGAMLGSVVPGIGTAVGAIVGGAAGFIGGVLGMGSAAKEAAKAMEEARKQVSISLDALHAKATGDSFAEGAAQIAADREAQRKAIEDAYSGGGANSDTVRTRNYLLAKMNADEDALLAKLKEQIELQKQTAREDIQVRTLRNQGATLQADILAKQLADQREYADAVKNQMDPTYLAQLKWNQAIEENAVATGKAAGAIGALTSGLNEVAGYKPDLQARVYQFMMPPGTGFGSDSPFGASGSGSLPPFPTAPVTQPNLPGRMGGNPASVPPVPPVTATLVVNLDSREIARTTKALFQDDAQRQFGDSTRWGETA